MFEHWKREIFLNSMAATAAVTTLMVLLSNSEMDFERLWNYAGGFNNDVQLAKHLLPFPDVIADGNFRSDLVDIWQELTFDTVSLFGMNEYGGVLWETEFNFTGTTNALTSWLSADNIVDSTQTTGLPDVVVMSDQYYRLRIGPASDLTRSWFAVTFAGLTFGPMPQVFAARSPTKPFGFPNITDGLLGCWNHNLMDKVEPAFTDTAGLTPQKCIAKCEPLFTAALLIGGDTCKCGSTSKTMLDEESNCYLTCTGSDDTCGGLDTGYASAYHVQGTLLPGELEAVLAYSANFTNVTVIELESVDITGNEQPVFVSGINVDSHSPNHYTVFYSEQACNDGELKQLRPEITFNVSSTIYSVSILKVACLVIHLNSTAKEVIVNIYSPQPSEHIEVPVVVVVGNQYAPGAASTTATSTTAETTTLTSNSNTTNGTTTVISSVMISTTGTTKTASNTTTSTIGSTTSTTGPTTSTTEPTTSTTGPTTSTTGPTTSTTEPTTSTTGPTTSTTGSTTSTTGPTTSTTIPTTSTTEPTTSTIGPTTSTTEPTTSTTEPTTSTTGPTTSTTGPTTSTTIPTTSTTEPTTSTTEPTTSTTEPTTSTTIPTISTTDKTTSTTEPTTSTTEPTTSTTIPTTSTTIPTTSTTEPTTSTTEPTTFTTEPTTSTTIPTTSTYVKTTYTAEPTTSTTVTTTLTIHTTTPTNADSSTTNYVTVSSTETGVTSTTDLTTDIPMCACSCNDTVPQLNMTTEELQARIEEIQRILAVNTSELSATIRRLTSAEDSRPSAQGIGYLGLTLLVVLFGSIVLMDSPTLIKDAKLFYNNLRCRTCGSSRKFVVNASE